MDVNDRLYTKDADGLVSTWYLCAWHGPRFSVAPIRNAKRSTYKKFFHMDDIGKTIFLTKKEAINAPTPAPF